MAFLELPVGGFFSLPRVSSASLASVWRERSLTATVLDRLLPTRRASAWPGIPSRRQSPHSPGGRPFCFRSLAFPVRCHFCLAFASTIYLFDGTRLTMRFSERIMALGLPPSSTLDFAMSRR